LSQIEKDHGPTTVCVTGVTGYVGSSVARRLLQCGHTVHGTCRNPESKQAQAVMRLPGARSRLKLYKADMTAPGSFQEAFRNCTHVIHVASPVMYNVPPSKVDERLVGPALAGVENVLAEASRVASITKVVMTSTLGAVLGTGGVLPARKSVEAGKVYTEEDWSDRYTKTNCPYFLSKTLAEKEAWKLAAKASIELVTICPGIVMGPPCIYLGGAFSRCESIAFMGKLLIGMGFPMAPPLTIPFTDVRDVAKMHTVAMSSPSATGRYIGTSGVNDPVGIGNALRRDTRTSGSFMPYFEVPGFMKRLIMLVAPPVFGISSDIVSVFWGKDYSCSTSKAHTQLDMTFTDFSVTCADMVLAMRFVRGQRSHLY